MSSSTTIKEIAPLKFILNAQMTVKASDAAAFLEITQKTNDLALAEPECVFFNFGRREPINDLTFEPTEGGDGDEVVFWWSEGWNCSLEWYRNVQFKREYYGPHMKVVEPMWTKTREFWTFFFPLFGCVCVNITVYDELTVYYLAVFEIYRPEKGGCQYKQGM